MRPLDAADAGSGRRRRQRRRFGRLGLGRNRNSVIAVSWYDCFLAVIVVTLLVVHLHHGGSAAASSSSESSKKDNSGNATTASYEWQDLNYYEILGLESPPEDGSSSSASSSSTSSKDIRKAYRRQAQQWHPDKLIGKKEQNITVQESNSRFARIAEAYQVLSNDDTRDEYNRYLRQYQQQQQQYEQREQQRERQRQETVQQQERMRQQQRQSDASWSTSWTWNDFSMQDPLRMFEEFFYGTAADEEEDDDWSWTHNNQAHADPYDEYPRGSSFGRRQDGSPSSSSFQSALLLNRPIRIYEQEQVLIDPRTGREILRILQTSEYYVPNNNRQRQEQPEVYYRVVAQDFVEEWDRYQRAFVYYPLQQEPFVVEEGYHGGDPSAPRQETTTEQTNNNNKQQQQQQQQSDTISSILLPKGVLVPDSSRRPSLQNGRFTAGISSRCEVWIADAVWNTVVWTSETDMPLGYLQQQQQQQQQDCRLALRGPYLVLLLAAVAVGYPEQLVWYSGAVGDGDDDDMDVVYYHMEFETDDNESYLARLDSDGSLAVYQRQTVDSPRWLLQILSSSSSSSVDKNKLASTVARIGQTMLRLVIDRAPSFSLEEPSSASSSSLPTLQRLVCVSATGPVGCLGILRPVVKWLRDAVLAVQWAVSKLDRFLEKVL
jgi:curved DNA-binding protein CbpA